MLRELGIRNYALIEETRVQLEPGLTVVTGETGAGKSMMFDALLIALGERAGADRVRPGAERAEIEALFEQPCAAALEWLRAQDLDDDDDGDCVVRRVIRADGRSRLHINGRSASAQQVRELAGLLLDVQGQPGKEPVRCRFTPKHTHMNVHGVKKSYLRPLRRASRRKSSRWTARGFFRTVQYVRAVPDNGQDPATQTGCSF